eukprot:TRINITY_DN67700_c0_g1_i1.p2 TRINITY_DN67700_c0_g1~~TRINITY_DN67700_c0_g1_i1.p2  ORF type:complete len:235 (-),score=13.34 TRINITY_DN67700_c0_g1_i1:171-875(-)
MRSLIFLVILLSCVVVGLEVAGYRLRLVDSDEELSGPVLPHRFEVVDGVADECKTSRDNDCMFSVAGHKCDQTSSGWSITQVCSEDFGATCSDGKCVDMLVCHKADKAKQARFVHATCRCSTKLCCSMAHLDVRDSFAWTDAIAFMFVVYFVPVVAYQAQSLTFRSGTSTGLEDLDVRNGEMARPSMAVRLHQRFTESCWLSRHRLRVFTEDFLCTHPSIVAVVLKCLRASPRD